MSGSGALWFDTSPVKDDDFLSPKAFFDRPENSEKNNPHLFMHHSHSHMTGGVSSVHQTAMHHLGRSQGYPFDVSSPRSRLRGGQIIPGEHIKTQTVSVDCDHPHSFSSTNVPHLNLPSRFRSGNRRRAAASTADKPGSTAASNFHSCLQIVKTNSTMSNEEKRRLLSSCDMDGVRSEDLKELELLGLYTKDEILEIFRKVSVTKEQDSRSVEVNSDSDMIERDDHRVMYKALMRPRDDEREKHGNLENNNLRMKRGASQEISKEETEEQEKKEEETSEEKTSSSVDSPAKKRANVADSEEKKEEKKEAAPFSFSFGSSATNDNSAFKFDFSGSSSGAAPFSFGESSNSGGFQFSFASTIPLSTSSEEKKDEEGEEDPEKDLTTNDGPVKVKTLAKEELVNGEEGEENVYTIPKMKLFELRTVEVESKADEEGKDKSEKDEKKETSEKKVWQERGLGVLRLNVDKKTKVARILIRREPTHQSIANFNIIPETKVTVDPVRKHVMVQTIEPADVDTEEEPKKEEETEKKSEAPKAKISFYMIRVSSKEIAEELYAKISEHLPKDKEEKKEDK